MHRWTKIKFFLAYFSKFKFNGIANATSARLGGTTGRQRTHLLRKSYCKNDTVGKAHPSVSAQFSKASTFEL